ncbi:MAG: hypothetical protein WD555_03770 [Fulvivirga sp.]
MKNLILIMLFVLSIFLFISCDKVEEPENNRKLPDVEGNFEHPIVGTWRHSHTIFNRSAYVNGGWGRLEYFKSGPYKNERDFLFTSFKTYNYGHLTGSFDIKDDTIFFEGTFPADSTLFTIKNTTPKELKIYSVSYPSEPFRKNSEEIYDSTRVILSSFYLKEEEKGGSRSD